MSDGCWQADHGDFWSSPKKETKVEQPFKPSKIVPNVSKANEETQRMCDDIIIMLREDGYDSHNILMERVELLKGRLDGIFTGMMMLGIGQ